MSLGHFISAFSMPILFNVFSTATPVARVINGIFEWVTFGFNIIDNQTPPRGDSQFLPDRPLAFVCFSEITTAPFPTPFIDKNLAIVFVDITSLNIYISLPMYLVFRFLEILSLLIYLVSSFPSSLTKSEKSLISILLNSSIVFSDNFPSFFNSFTISFCICKSPNLFFIHLLVFSSI